MRSADEPSADSSEEVTCSRFCDLIGDLDFEIVDQESLQTPFESDHVSGWGLGTRLIKANTLFEKTLLQGAYSAGARSALMRMRK